MGRDARGGLMLYTKEDRARIVPEQALHASGGRSVYRQDYGRLLHSPCFRRLQGKTQLFPSHESDFFRNRLTHSLEVAQVAKAIALHINATERAFQADQINTDLVELAALAHDLGHPPFGHNGEAALDECMKACGGFEGNAQTLRLLARIEKKVFRGSAPNDPEGSYCGIGPDGVDYRAGLNLTFRSLAAVLKYDRPIPAWRKPGDKLAKGYYQSEAPLVGEIKRRLGAPPDGLPFKTIECQIMDLADDIAYSTYDLEDAMKGGFTHPLAIRACLSSNPALVKRVHAKVAEAVPDATEAEVFRTLEQLFDLGGYGGGSREADAAANELQAFQQSTLLASQGRLRVGFTSHLVGRFINGIRVNTLPRRHLKFSRVDLDRPILLQIESLKHLNYQTMIMSPRLKVVENRGFDLVREIFESLRKKDGHHLLPEDYQLMYHRAPDDEHKQRLLCDFIAGMTDRYAAEFHSRISGSGASIFKPL